MAIHSHPGQKAKHVRVINSVLGKLEKRTLLWLAARTPAWVTPDLLTALGMVSAFMIFLGYSLSTFDKGYLWLASLGFLLHWYGDSMDGTLARYRKIERPRYGYFIDHTLDAVSATLIFLGIGLSPYVRFDLALLTLVVYLLISIFVYLATYANGVFRISYAGLGPTETRLIAVAANTVIFFSKNPTILLGGMQVTYLDLVVIALCFLGAGIFLFQSIQMASILSKEEPATRKDQNLKERSPRKQGRTSAQKAIREDYSAGKVTGEAVKQEPSFKRVDVKNE